MFSTVFKEPTLLTYDKDFSVEPVNSYAYANALYYVPLLQTEIAKAACSYPVLFAKTEEGMFPLALLSLREGKNAFLQEDGSWEKEQYIPAFLKTYPFAVTMPAWNEPSRVMYDAAYRGINTMSDQSIDMIKNKALTEKGQKILENIQSHYIKFEETMKTLGELESLDLFKEAEVALLTENEKQNRLLKDIYQIDVEKLDSLSDKKLLLLLKSGMMAIIYFHLSSISNIAKLQNRL
jgi:hypothetical protein